MLIEQKIEQNVFDFNSHYELKVSHLKFHKIVENSIFKMYVSFLHIS